MNSWAPPLFNRAGSLECIVSRQAESWAFSVCPWNWTPTFLCKLVSAHLQPFNTSEPPVAVLKAVIFWQAGCEPLFRDRSIGPGVGQPESPVHANVSGISSPPSKLTFSPFFFNMKKFCVSSWVNSLYPLVWQPPATWKLRKNDCGSWIDTELAKVCSIWSGFLKKVSKGWCRKISGQVLGLICKMSWGPQAP